MYEIRRIGRKKNGDCMYGHIEQASVYKFTRYGKLCQAFPKTRNPRGSGELTHVLAEGLGCRRDFKTLTFPHDNSKGRSERSIWNDLVQTGGA